MVKDKFNGGNKIGRIKQSVREVHWRKREKGNSPNKCTTWTVDNVGRYAYEFSRV